MELRLIELKFSLSRSFSTDYRNTINVPRAKIRSNEFKAGDGVDKKRVSE